MEVWRQLAVQVNGWARYNGFTNLSKTCMVDQCLVEAAHGVLWWAPGNMTLRIFLKATLIKGSITTNNTHRPGMEGGEAWAGVRSLGRVKDLEQELWIKEESYVNVSSRPEKWPTLLSWGKHKLIIVGGRMAGFK